MNVFEDNLELEEIVLQHPRGMRPALKEVAARSYRTGSRAEHDRQLVLDGQHRKPPTEDELKAQAKEIVARLPGGPTFGCWSLQVPLTATEEEALRVMTKALLATIPE